MLEAHIEVADLDRAFEFYKRLLPYRKEIRWSDGKAGALVFDDGSAFGIWEQGMLGIHDGRAAAHLHFAFQIEPDEYAAYKRKIAELGLEPREHTWPNGHKSVYFFDPDGHQGEFMTCDWFGLRND